MRDDDAYHVGDEQIEWTGRADGIEDAQFSFSDMKPIMQALEVAAHGTGESYPVLMALAAAYADAKANVRL